MSRGLGPLLLAAAVLAAPAGAQQPDSVQVIVTPVPFYVEGLPEGPLRVYQGDTITLRARIMGPDSLPTPGVLRWSVTDSAVARLQVVDDSTVRVIPLGRGAAHVVVEPMPLDSIVVGNIRFERGEGLRFNGQTPDDPFEFEVGEQVILCAFFWSSGALYPFGVETDNDRLCIEEAQALELTAPAADGRPTEFAVYKPGLGARVGPAEDRLFVLRAPYTWRRRGLEAVRELVGGVAAG